METAAKFYLRRSRKYDFQNGQSKPVNEQGILHFDRNTNLNPGVKCDRCPQNTPLHPAEHPHANSAIPVGGGFRLTVPDKVGAWDFRLFTFLPN